MSGEVESGKVSDASKASAIADFISSLCYRMIIYEYKKTNFFDKIP